jgi:alpha-1,2-mannosyltransferase
MQIYHELNKPSIKHSHASLETKELINVCVSKEWYRFPSSFFMPETIDINVRQQKWRLRFLPSDFKGQLPGYFNETTSIPYSTRHVDKHFNDLNKEVRQRYVDIRKCQFFVDTDASSEVDDERTHLFLNKKNTNTKWKTLVKLPFVDSAASNRLYRSFYIPYLYETHIKQVFFKLKLKLD